MPNKIDPTGCPVPPEDTNPDYCGAIGKDCKDFQSCRVRVAELERPNHSNSGWICPRCGRVNAPTTPSCFCHPENFPVSPTC